LLGIEVKLMLEKLSVCEFVTASCSLQDDDTRALLRADFEIGQAIRDRIIPRAVLFYTGEAGEDDDFDEDADDEEDEVGVG
jgi:hypothetical protein